MIARRSARQITLTLSDDPKSCGWRERPSANSCSGSSPVFSTAFRQSSAPIACSLALRLPKSNPFSCVVRYALDFGEVDDWHAACMHFGVMRMQPNAQFDGQPVPEGSGPTAIELSETSVTFGRAIAPCRLCLRPACGSPTVSLSHWSAHPDAANRPFCVSSAAWCSRPAASSSSAAARSPRGRYASAWLSKTPQCCRG